MRENCLYRIWNDLHGNHIYAVYELHQLMQNTSNILFAYCMPPGVKFVTIFPARVQTRQGALDDQTSIFFPLFLTAHLQDIKILHCVGQYFVLNRGGPELVSVDVFEHPELGRTLKITIIGRRTQTGKDLAYAFTAIAAVANLCEQKFDLLWVEMNGHFKGSDPTMALAPAQCTIDALILQEYEKSKWWNGCLQFL